MKLHPNIAIVRRFYHAFISRDTATLWAMAGENLVFHMPGRSKWAGTHRGREQILELYTRLGAETERSLRTTIHDIVGGEKHVVGLHHVTATMKGRSLDINGTAVFHVEDGKIIEAWLSWQSQKVFDEFWN